MSRAEKNVNKEFRFSSWAIDNPSVIVIPIWSWIYSVYYMVKAFLIEIICTALTYNAHVAIAKWNGLRQLRSHSIQGRQHTISFSFLKYLMHLIRVRQCLAQHARFSKIH